MSNIGVVYAIALSPGGRYLREATISANSLKKRCPGLPIAIATDLPRYVHGPFDHVIGIGQIPPGRGTLVKPYALKTTPFMYTLLLDCDTYVCGDVTPMFEILNYHDVSMAVAPRRKDPDDPLKNAPEWFPERNTGVILMRRNKQTTALLDEWIRTYSRINKWNDQIAMRDALFNAVKRGLRLYDLPPEWHCRTIMMQLLGGHVKILHGRHKDKSLGDLCNVVNSHTGVRLYLQGHGIVRPKDWRKVK